MLVVSTSFAQEDRLARIYEEARAAEAAGDYKMATHRYETLAQSNPGIAEIHANLGNLYYAQNLHDKAKAACLRAIRLKPALAVPHVLLGIISFHRREYPAAKEMLRKAAQLDKTNPLIPLYLGYTHHALSDYSSAAQFLQAVVEADRSHLDAWYHLSKAHSQVSKRFFDRLQTAHKDSPYTHLARSHFFEAGASWEQAKEELARALELAGTPEAWKPAITKRIAWLGARKPGEAAEPPPVGPEETMGSTTYLHAPPDGIRVIEAYQEEARKVRTPDGTMDLPSRDLFIMAEAHQAMSYLAALWVLQTGSGTHRAHQLQGQFHEAAGQLDEAIAEYHKAVALKPDLPTVHFAIGSIHWRRNHMEEALVELKKELAINPADAQAHYETGDIYLVQNKPDLAEKHLKLAIQHAPNMAEAHLALERTATARNDDRQALAHLRAAAKLSPDDATAHYRLWLLLRKLGRTAEAEQERKLFERLRENKRAP